MRALVIGDNESLSWSLPSLLARAGFTVDVITRSPVFIRSAFAKAVHLVPMDESVAAYAIRFVGESSTNYNWIILAEDALLSEILESSAPDCLKLKLLPVLSEKHFGHLFSKIGLATAFKNHGISTPAFCVVNTLGEAAIAAQELGYSLMLKVDSSGGGEGTYPCHCWEDINRLEKVFDGKPLLLQKMVPGRELDLTSIYRDGKLIHFNYAVVKKKLGHFGPHVLRDYLPLESVSKEVVDELQRLGEALGANGFVNVTCLESDGNRYYIEADMRPNVWVQFPRFLGDDPAEKIEAWFLRRTYMRASDVGTRIPPGPYVSMPYFMRLSIFELMTNRYGVWKYIPMEDKKVVLYLLLYKLFLRGRSIVPKRYRYHLKLLVARVGAQAERGAS